MRYRNDQTGMNEADAGLGRGFELHRLGRLTDAEQVCQEVLRQRPNDFDALHLLGVIALQTHRTESGVELIAKAIRLNPNVAAAHNNLGNGLLALSRFEDAVSSYDKAIALGTDFAETYHSRGKALSALDRPEAAIASYDRAIAQRPGHAEAFYNRGNAQRSLDRHAEAVASYDRALASKADFADAHYNRGNALRDLHRLEEAAGSYEHAISIRPDEPNAYYNLSNVLLELHRFEDAVASCDKAIALRPDFAAAWRNRGNGSWALNRPDEAIASYDQAIALRPDNAEAYSNRAVALTERNRHEEAIASYDNAIALKPDDATAYAGQSLCRLATGDFERGWALYEWRWKTGLAHARPDLPGLPWLGDEPIDGKTILVLAEQGFGDTLQFCRYVPMLAALATVVLCVPRPLMRLLSGLEGVSRIVAEDDPLPAFDAWTPMMSLPLAFRTTLASIPESIHYLYANPERSAAWRNRLAALPSRKIGLVWSGSRRPENYRANAVDQRRSITLQHYAPLAAIPGLCMISLQKGDAATPPEGMVLHDWTDELDDFSDTAALVDALDLVISVDTAVVHLAGALGKPVWVLNRYDQCWRWLRNRTDSPWYPSARLFQQRTPGDWSGVIDDVVEALRGD
jgi:tetratricopeptide (TPR) repeat protein